MVFVAIWDSLRTLLLGSCSGHTATLCFSLGKTDELVADDVVCETEGTLKFIESTCWCDTLDNEVVPRFFLIDWVSKSTLAPPIRLAVEGTSG
jgi:hypothetical protein